MQVIQLEKRPIRFQDFIKRRAQAEDCTNIITEPCVVMDGDKRVCIYDELREDTSALASALRRVKYQTTTRTNGLKTTSRIFGYSPRNILRKDFCGATSLATEAPGIHELIGQFAKIITNHYREKSPEVFDRHFELVEKTKKEWVIPGSVFTSGIINKNNPLKYHFDTGNFKDVYSCMLVLRRNVEGGLLCLPEYDTSFLLKNNALFMFDGQNILHGVTPMTTVGDGYRYSLVFYALRQMWKCLTVDEEIARIRTLKMQRERKRL